MILDHLDHTDRYVGLAAGFREAFEFLKATDLAALAEGRHSIDGDRIYAMVVRESGKGREGATLEAHRTYIDIQYALAGTDEIGWKPTARCSPDAAGYDASKDLVLFADAPASWATTPPGTFAIFFPHDAHAPLGGVGEIRKIVVKVAAG